MWLRNLSGKTADKQRAAYSLKSTRRDATPSLPLCINLAKYFCLFFYCNFANFFKYCFSNNVGGSVAARNDNNVTGAKIIQDINNKYPQGRRGGLKKLVFFKLNINFMQKLLSFCFCFFFSMLYDILVVVLHVHVLYNLSKSAREWVPLQLFVYVIKSKSFLYLKK